MLCLYFKVNLKMSIFINCYSLLKQIRCPQDRIQGRARGHRPGCNFFDELMQISNGGGVNAVINQGRHKTKIRSWKSSSFA